VTVTDTIMKEFLKEIPKGGITTRELGRRLQRNDSNIRRCMTAMADLGLVEQICKRHGKNGRFIWIKREYRSPTDPNR